MFKPNHSTPNTEEDIYEKKQNQHFKWAYCPSLLWTFDLGRAQAESLGVKPWPVGVRKVAFDYWMGGIGSKRQSIFTYSYLISLVFSIQSTCSPSSFRLSRQDKAKPWRSWHSVALL